MELSSVLSRLASLYSAQGQYAKAESFYTRALKVQVRQLEAKNVTSRHPYIVSAVRGLLAVYGLTKQDAKEKALRQWADSIGIYRRILESEYY